MALLEAAELAVLITLKDQISGPLRNIDSSLSGIGTRAATVGGGLGKIGAGIGLAAERVAMASVAMGGSLIAVAASATASASKYQADMELIATQAGASQAEVDSMSQSLLALAPQVGTTADDLAAGLYHIESAGNRGAQALDLLKVAAEGAKVGQANLEDVTNALVGAVNTGISGTQDYASAMGSLNAIVGAGNMRMADLTDAFATGILPTAKTFGLTITDVGAALADMTDQGIPAADAATRLRMTLSLLGAPTSKAAKELESIGITSTQLGTEMRQPNGLLVALTDLKTHLDASGMSATQQAALLSAAFGGGRSSSAIMTLLGSLDRLQTKYDTINAGTNNFNTAWEQTGATVDEQKASMFAALDSLKLKLGEDLLPAEGAALGGLEQLFASPQVLQAVDDFGTALASLFSPANVDEAVKFAEGVIPQIEGFASDTLPTLVGGLKMAGEVAKEAFDMFNSLPGPVKEAVIAALAANKLSGGLVASGIGDLAKVAMGAATGSGGGLLGVQHVWVDNMGLGGMGGGGIAGDAAGAAEGAAGAGAAEAGLMGVAAPVAVLAAATAVSVYATSQALSANNALATSGLTANEIRAYKFSQMTPMEQGRAAGEGYGKLSTYNADLASALEKLSKSLDTFTPAAGPAAGSAWYTPGGIVKVTDTSLEGAISAWRNSDTQNLADASNSLDSAVQKWRAAPTTPTVNVNVTVSTTVSAKAQQEQVHYFTRFGGGIVE